VSGVEAAIHGGDELWFGIGAGLEFGFKYVEKWTRSSFGIEQPLNSDLTYSEFAQSFIKTVSPRMQRDLL
jgi:hypothetical protein